MRLSDVTYNSWTGFGTFGTVTSNSTALTNIDKLISLVVGSITVIGGVYFAYQIFTGAVGWISSGSDKEGVSRAQKKFTNALLGLIALIFSYNIIGLIGRLFGLDILNFVTVMTSIIP